MIAEKWFKNYFPSQYKQYIIELLKNNEEENQEHIASKYRDISIKKNVVIKKEDNEEKEISSFFPILKGNTDLFDKAREFCKKRLIPEKIWHRWYVSTKNRYGRRIIIPFYDNENKIYYYQARTISNQIPKYTSRVGEKQIYNIYNVDKTKPIQVCEGPIDSCFLENSIATLGCSLADDKLDFIKKLGKVYWLFDFDEAGLKESNKYISDGEYVFLWKKFIKEFNLSGMVSNQKIDINDVIVHLNKKDGFTFEELEKFYSSSIYDKIWL